MSELNDWFLSLPEARQAVLRDDKWFLAEAAFAAGKAARAQPAQAGQVLTDDQLLAMWAGSDERALRPILGKNKILSFARAIEAAVRAKMGVAVPMPMTLAQIIRLTDEIPLHEGGGWFVDVVRAAEKFHGIVGKEDA